jgi:hypothetical protein
MDKEGLAHELLDRSYLIMEMVDAHLIQHVSNKEGFYIEDPEKLKEVKGKLEVAHKALFDVYQLAGNLP